MQREGELSSHSTTHPRTLSTLLYLEIFVTKLKKKKKEVGRISSNSCVNFRPFTGQLDN